MQSGLKKKTRLLSNPALHGMVSSILTSLIHKGYSWDVYDSDALRLMDWCIFMDGKGLSTPRTKSVDYSIYIQEDEMLPVISIKDSLENVIDNYTAIKMNLDVQYQDILTHHDAIIDSGYPEELLIPFRCKFSDFVLGRDNYMFSIEGLIESKKSESNNSGK